MNNEPVAWMQTWENQDGELKHTVDIERVGKNDIPLYTHPSEHDLGIAESIGFDKGYKAATAKTLTDGEIVKIFQTTEFWQYSDLVHENDAIEFARAILKKASFTCNGFCGEQECKEKQDGCKRIKKASEK
jgi:hypothetical protein